MHQEVVDLKEALRWMVAAPLAQQLGVQCEREGDLRIMLAYLHPASSSETDFLFINGGGGKGRGYKRKRGQPKVMYAGALLKYVPVVQTRPDHNYSMSRHKQCAWRKYSTGTDTANILLLCLPPVHGTSSIAVCSLSCYNSTTNMTRDLVHGQTTEQ